MTSNSFMRPKSLTSLMVESSALTHIYRRSNGATTVRIHGRPWLVRASLPENPRCRTNCS